MSNSNEHNTYNREVRQESNKDINGNPYTNVTRTTETVNNTKVTPNRDSYRDGYVHGSVVERNYQQADLVERDNNNAARGLLLGILLASLTAITVGAIWLFNQRNETPVPVTPPVIVPQEEPKPTPPPEAKQSPEKETRIIEKEKPVFIPVPQQQAPASPAPSPAPKQEVNLTVPNSAPQPSAAEKAPANQTAPTMQPQSQSNSTGTEAKPSDTAPAMPKASSNQPSTTSTTPPENTLNQPSTTSTTPPENTLNQPSTTSGNNSAPNDAGSTGGSAQ